MERSYNDFNTCHQNSNENMGRQKNNYGKGGNYNQNARPQTHQNSNRNDGRGGNRGKNTNYDKYYDDNIVSFVKFSI